MPAEESIIITDRHVLFWGGWPSQWAKSRFTVNGVPYNCCEQFMMAEKARVFGDTGVLEQILREPNPRQQKALGREVKGFDADTWQRVCRGIVYRGNHARFSQDDVLRRILFETGDRMIVEASPRDTIWGVGLGPNNPLAQDPAHWRGTNWLGIAIMQVRASLNGTTVPEKDELDRQLAARSELK